MQIKLSEYRNIDLIYKGLANTFKVELQKMVGSCQTIQDKDRVIEELIRYNVILKEEHSKMSDDKQDLVRNLDRITAQCEKMQLEKRQAIKRYDFFFSHANFFLIHKKYLFQLVKQLQQIIPNKN